MAAIRAMGRGTLYEYHFKGVGLFVMLGFRFFSVLKVLSLFCDGASRVSNRAAKNIVTKLGWSK